MNVETWTNTFLLLQILTNTFHKLWQMHFTILCLCARPNAQQLSRIAAACFLKLFYHQCIRCWIADTASKFSNKVLQNIFLEHRRFWKCPRKNVISKLQNIQNVAKIVKLLMQNWAASAIEQSWKDWRCDIKGIVHNFLFSVRTHILKWIVMGCGIADFGRRGLKTT